MAKGVTRLYRQFVPENYQLFVDIDEKTMTFSGSVTISGRKTGRPSQRLTFHQKDLNVTEASVIFTDKKGGARPVKIDRINAHNSYDEVRLHASEMIYPGKYEVTMKFNGKITDGIHGLYPCNFVQDGKKEKLFATQFESHHAREVFPCIDEPKAKASFDLTLTTQTGVEVLSNTEIKNQKTDSGRLITSFQQTPIMSTYLLAFIFGEIHCVGGISKNGVTVRSWATVAQPQSHLQYATDEAVKILDFFENYFDTPFPLKKLDMVALPDFESGAMENWGLITYREVLLLADPINRSLPSEQTISMVIAHEMSHQWFGNLVTMSWWDDLWLNESFASIMEHLPLDALHPDWHQWEQYAAYDIPLCSGRDIYSDVQSVGIGVNHPDEISTIFDSAIVYSKGGRLIKMMREYIGEDAFKSGLKSYFKKHAYGNTYREELWDEMSLASGKDIKKLMTPWLTQSGMPVVKISGVVNGKRQLSQSRFVLDKQDDSIWPIPLLSSDLTHKILDQKTSQIDSQTTPFINPRGSGHYVTHYADDKDLAAIISRIKDDPNLSEARINVLNDQMLLARRGDDSIVDALKLVQELGGETRDAVWLLMARAMGITSNLGENNTVIEDGLKKFRYKLANKNYQNLGWDDAPNDDPNTKLLRSTMIALMLASEDSKILNEAQKIFKNTKKIEDIPSDRRGLVLSTIVRHFDNQETVDMLVKKYQTTQDSDLQNTICSALTSTKSSKVAERLLKEALGDGGFVRIQDVFRWFAYMIRGKYTRDQTWQWMKDNWNWIEKNFGHGKHYSDFVIYSSGPLQTPEWEKEFNKFFEPLTKNMMLGRDIRIAQAEIAARVAWRTRELKLLETFFKNLS